VSGDTGDRRSTRDGAYDDWLDAVEAGEPFYLECANGHGLLPPRRICPECGSRSLAERPLPATGEILTHTTVTVPAPAFADDAPYVTAIADFEGVRLTGVVAAPTDDVESGAMVSASLGETDTRGERVLTFDLVE